MNVILMILYCTIVLGILVVIHEGGHYLASRAFGVRVTEFMLGMPGPNIGFKKWGTKFGVTPILLGGYARVCGMEPGEMSPHLEPVLAALYRRGTANMEDIARDCGIPDEDALKALDELVDWGSCPGPTKKDEYNTYRAAEVIPSKKQIRVALKAGKPAPERYAEGQARPVEDAHALFESEYRQQYRSLPFWKRSVILLAGIAVNLLFAMLVFVVLFSVIGFDVRMQSGEVTHMTVGPGRAIVVYRHGCAGGCGAVQPGNGGANGVRFVFGGGHRRDVEAVRRCGLGAVHAVHGHDLGVAGHHEPAAHPSARRRSFRYRGVPEAVEEGGLHARHERHERRRHGLVPDVFPGHGQPGRATHHLGDVLRAVGGPRSHPMYRISRQGACPLAGFFFACCLYTFRQRGALRW